MRGAWCEEVYGVRGCMVCGDVSKDVIPLHACTVMYRQPPIKDPSSDCTDSSSHSIVQML